jgi:putative ABC transport system permease protein
MSVIWHKTWRDLANSKARTTLVVISTAVGVFALGLVFGLSGVMGQRLTAAHREALPAHITFQGGPFGSETVDAIEHGRGVGSAQGEISVPLRWRFENDGESAWRDGILVARAHYDDQSIDLLRLREGRWPAGRLPHSRASAVALDRLSVEHFGVEIGTIILVEAGQRERLASVEGVMHAHDVLSPGWGGTATFYATPQSVVRLTDYEDEEHFNRLQVRLDAFSPRGAEEAAEQIEARLERMGLTVGGYEIKDPHVHPMQEQVDAVLIVLGVMGALSLGLSAFLIINTINAILVREVRQIAVMKAVGARLLGIIRIYLVTALIYGALALLLAVPLGVIGAQLVAVWLLGMFNVTLAAFQFQPLAVGIQIAVALAVPPLAALGPVLKAARTTVREAICDYGLSNSFGESALDRLTARLRFLPRVIALSLRNTLRSKPRVALTLVMLTFGGAIFTTVMSTKDALDSTFHVIFELEGDVAISLEHPHRASRLIEIAQGVPGVARAEVWDSHEAALASDHGKGEEPPLHLIGMPPHSVMCQPRIVGGRNLRADDGRAILVNNRLIAEEGIRLEDTITLKIDGDESDWTVVGSYLSLNVLQDICFVPQEALAREAHTRGQGTNVKVLAERGGHPASERRLIASLTDAFEANNIEVSDSWSASRQWQESRSAFGVLIYLLLAMAVLVATVGSIGLMSTMSINVVERTREIGVMRAIGATAATIVVVFVAEGVLVGVLSWLLALPLSLPGAYVLSSVVGQAIVRIPLDFAYSTSGALLWLLIVFLLSALASLWPALRATHVSVRESLAYE